MMNKTIKRIALVLILVVICLPIAAKETYLYAKKDTSSLYLDIHRATAGTLSDFQGVPKPTIIHLFGGGFKSGTRDAAHLLKYYQMLNDNGYNVVAIDYRLGMKNYKMGNGLVGIAKSVTAFYASQQMGVEDLYSAILFLASHPELGIDVHNLVLSGNSAGAIISLASAYVVANGEAEGLPEHFQFKGVLGFAGGIISLRGAPKFETLPCPILFFHGINDNVVAYNHLGAFGRGIWGSNYLAAQLKKKGGNYSIYRFKDRAHDVASYMTYLWAEEKTFLESNVMHQTPCIIDALVDNPALPVRKEWSTITPQEMYNGGGVTQ